MVPRCGAIIASHPASVHSSTLLPLYISLQFRQMQTAGSSIFHFVLLLESRVSVLILLLIHIPEYLLPFTFPRFSFEQGVPRITISSSIAVRACMTFHRTSTVWISVETIMTSEYLSKMKIQVAVDSADPFFYVECWHASALGTTSRSFHLQKKCLISSLTCFSSRFVCAFFIYHHTLCRH